MPYIDIIPLKRATGLLKKQYEAALARAGRIWGIVSIMSPQPPDHEGLTGFLQDPHVRPLTPEPGPVAKCWPWSFRPRTTACTEYEPTPTTSGLRSLAILPLKKEPRPTDWCISCPQTGAVPICRRLTVPYAPLPKN